MAAPPLHSSASTPPREASESSKFLRGAQLWRRILLLVLILAILAGLVYWRLRYDLRAYALLARFTKPKSQGLVLSWQTNPIAITNLAIPAAGGSIPARLYLPVGVAHPPGVVIAHGIHHLGFDDPRFVNLARALSGVGLVVLTPAIASLADYRVDSGCIAIIGDSAEWLEARLGRGPVTVIGISFSGGLALMAAAEPRYQPYVRAVVSLGGYDDLGRVARFLATSQEEYPDGKFVPHAAHDYGAAVFVYGHLPQFFVPADLPDAREALRYYLWEQPERAAPFLPRLSPAGRETMEILLARKIELLRPRLLAAIQQDQGELAALSPRGHIAALQAPIFLLHGSEDSVIPPAETLWLRNEVPHKELKDVLITPLFSHVDLNGSAKRWDKIRLVQFMGRVLRAAD